MFALDTNTLVYFFKGVGRVKDRLLAVSPSDVGIPSVVLYELEMGIAQSTQPAKRRSQLDALLTAVSVLPFDLASAKRSAELSSFLRKAGTAIGPMDNLIAGTALAHGATLVTHNAGEFRRVRGLTITDWL
ncbi:MAG: type II toxin-antitoxin system VapC family toxin [Bryobacteraceae bacterium]